MPNNSQRLQAIRALLLDAPLSQSAAEQITKELSALSQDSANSFVYFVLRHVLGDIANLLDGDAVSVDRHTELTEEIRIRAGRFLARADLEENTCLGDLKELVEGHIVRASIFRESRHG